MPYALPAARAADAQQLRDEIELMKKELERCKKMQKVWIGTTIAGGATAVVAGAMALDKKDKIDEKKRELESLK